MNCRECSRSIRSLNDLIVYDDGIGVRLPFLKTFHKNCFKNKFRKGDTTILKTFNKTYINTHIVGINKLSSQKILNYSIIILMIILFIALFYIRFLLSDEAKILGIVIVLFFISVPIYNLSILNKIEKFKLNHNL